MTWHTLANLYTNIMVTETHMDEIRENIEHLGAMKSAGTALSSLTAGADIGMQPATGSYTGDGTGGAGTGGQSITGVGFQPDVVLIGKVTNPNGYVFTVDCEGQSGTEGGLTTLDADGFTVNDGGVDKGVNANGVNFVYLALKID